MVFCTFCGYSNDEKCVQKTRLYPESAKDHDTGRPSQRGSICKLCDHKFMVREKVLKVEKEIKVSKISLVEMLKNLGNQGTEAKSQIHQEEESNEYILTKITEMEEENKKRKAEIQSLRQEKKNKKRDNELILRDKDTLEKEVRSKQEETEDLENVYKELLLLSNELKVIKKNEVPAMDAEDEW